MIINIPLQIDEKVIEGQLSKDFEAKLTDVISARIEEALAEKYYRWGRTTKETASANLIALIQSEIEDFFEKRREEIIQTAADKIVERVRRTKKVREAIQGEAKGEEDE